MDNIWIYGQALKVWSLVNVGLWNVPIGLWSSEDGLCNLDCETWRLDCETCRTDCETLKRGCETGIVKLWREIVKLWGEVVTLVLRNPELVQIRKSRSSKLHNQSPKFQNPDRQVSKFDGYKCLQLLKLTPLLQRFRTFFLSGTKGVGILISSCPCGQPKSVWSSTGVGSLISSYPCGQSKSVWSSMGGNFDIILPLRTGRVNFNFHRGWEFWYHLTLVDTPSQFEVPWGWEFWYQ